MADAVRLIGVSRSRIYEWIGAGLPSYNGSRPLILVAELEAAVESLPRGAPADGAASAAEDRALARERVGEPDFSRDLHRVFRAPAPQSGRE